MISHHLAEFGVHRHCGSGDMMYLVVEGKDSTCPRLNPQLPFILKEHDVPCLHTQNFRT